MKTLLKNIAGISLLSLFTIGATGCLEEEIPQGSTQTEEQVKVADKSALVSAIPAYMTTYSTDDSYDVGFAGFGVWRDAMTADLPVYDTGYDYFTIFNLQTYLGDYAAQTMFWKRYYYLLQKANSVIAVIDPDATGIDATYLATALTYRAWVYFDLMRTYEYKSTGVERLDAYAESNGLYGLTVPLITEKTTELESRNMPRAPFEQMYRFIMNDLNKAEELFHDAPDPASKDLVSKGVVYGMKARVWLDMGSRFDIHAEDLANQMIAEENPDYATLDKLAIKSANECFAKAATYARLAINQGYTPLTSSQWYDPKNGFNTINASWMWAIIVTTNNNLAKVLTWQSMPSFLSPEATYGVSHYTYGAYRMIDARLYTEINSNDWRRDTWINPNDVGNEAAFNSKYAKATSMTFNDWKNYDAYAGFKFHPAQGAVSVSTTGNATCTPLMRVEEMYLIEAEAAAHYQGAGAGQQLLESFMNSYRMKPGTTYAVANTELDGVVNEIFRQKRIELWGEGLILWDYRRLEKAIERGYSGTNHPEEYRFNSFPGKVAPWTTFYIPTRVFQLNPACKLNPDPSGAIPAWK